MKRLALLVVILTGVGPEVAHAVRNGDQGYGVMIGNPSGLSAKLWINDQIALDGAVGVARGEFDIHTSLLFHYFKWWSKSSLADNDFRKAVDRGEMPLYFGMGPRLLFEDDEEFGIRFPVGISYLPSESPWEGFAELAPVVRATPDFGFNGDFAIGVRYYFRTIRPRINN